MNSKIPAQAGQPFFSDSGWIQWPDYPELSLQFARMLGAAQQGAATVSECFQAAARMVPGDLQSWHVEWVRLAEQSLLGADTALLLGHVHTARSLYLRAAGYFRAAEWYLTPTDPARSTTYDRLESSTRAHVELLLPRGECVRIDVGDGTVLDAYFLKPGERTSSWPTTICFGGLDGHKDELVAKTVKHAHERGIALLLVDLPGQGATLRRRATPNRSDMEVPVARCIDYLLQRPDVQREQIALYGASMGGIYAARAASAERRLAAVVSDSLVFDLHAGLARRFEESQDDPTWLQLQWVFGCKTAKAVVEKSKAFGMKNYISRIGCPWLVLQGEHDFLGLQTAAQAVQFAETSGVQVTFKTFSSQETGASHCQVDNPTIGQEYIWDWLANRLQCANSSSTDQT